MAHTDPANDTTTACRPEDLLSAEHTRALVARLSRIEGQVRGIKRMVQEPRLCIEILQQLAAAEAALNRISLAVMRHHIDTCVARELDTSESATRKSLDELVDIFDRFAR